MGNAFFPNLPGLKVEVDKTPAFITKVQRSVSGRELRASYTSAPIWTFKLAYEFLRNEPAYGELQVLQGFFLTQRGSWDSFLYIDPDDFQVANERIGTGDGTTRSFQLTRTLGGFAEPVANVANAFLGRRMWDVDQRRPMWPRRGNSPAMWSTARDYVASEYTISASGLVTFNTAPAVGVPVCWSGTFYYRCRFKDDAQDYNQFMKGFWQAKKVEFVASLGTKI